MSPPPVSGEYFGDVLERRLSRREWLQGALLAGAALTMPGRDAHAQQGALSFTPIAGSRQDRVIVPPGYVHDVVIRWGDALFPDTPSLDVARLHSGVLFGAAAARQQARQFGTNCDALQFFQLNAGPRSARGVLCVNNEYTDDWLMFPGRKAVFGDDPKHVRALIDEYPDIVDVSQAAHGISVVEVRRERRWGYESASKYNRRITAQTPFEIRGPARGAAWLRTQQDGAGVRALGTFGNCAGGRTPWGTYLSAEENIQDYFGNFRGLQAARGSDPRVIEAHRRWRMWADVSPYGWDVTDRRFDMAQEPHEAFRFGWIVEVDPLDPRSTPVKRTALGRFAHESASPIVAASGQVAVYMGDDDKFEYVYKFVSTGRFNPQQPQANTDLLDVGTLYVARFNADGSGEWLPLVYDAAGPLNAGSGFRDQAEVLIKTRAAADVLGATTMDRPEDVEPNPLTGKIYVACTKNESRAAQPTQGRYGQRQLEIGPNPANPRGRNLGGHIIEISEQGDDHTALRFRWEIFLMGGDPRADRLLRSPDIARAGVPEKSAYYAGRDDARNLSAFAAPDNIGFDAAGNLWLVTDGDQPQGGNNGCFVCATAGPDRGRLMQFMSGPVGAEICGCILAPDNETLFLSVQHPGENGTLSRPTSHWPDGGELPPRPSVIAIRKEGGGVIGS